MNQRASTASHQPASHVSPNDVAAGLTSPPSPRWGMRRRVLVSVLVVLALLTTVAGVYAWQIISALSQAEQAAVVPLPTRARELSAAQLSPTPSPDAAADPTTVPTADGSLIDAATPGGSAKATTVASPASALPTDSPVTGTPVASPVVGGMTGTEQTPLATSEELSRLEIVELLINASMEGGDPGRASIWGGKPSIDVLVLGVDRRPDGGDQNSDVIIIARVDLLTKRVSAVSLPRDLLVAIPGVGEGKINGAYNAGIQADPDNPVAGVAKVRDTIETAYGVFIDGYVLIDFDGFQDVVDAIGGVDVVVPEGIVDDAYPTEDYGTERVEFSVGLEHMDGDRALKYVRTRSTDDDDARRERQLQVLLALFDQGGDIGSIRKVDEVIVALGDNVQTGFGLQQQLTLARVGLAMEREDVTLTTIEKPLISGGYNADGAWVYFSDRAEVAAFINQSLEAGSTPGS